MAWSTCRNSRFPIPPLPPWVSGRFYGAHYATNAVGASNQRRWLTVPILVPSYVTLASIGCEVTIGAASSYMRLAIYSNLEDLFWPDERLMQTAALDISVAQYVSEATSLKLRPGWYWLSGCWDVGGSLRFEQATYMLQAFVGPSITTPSAKNTNAVIDIGNSNAVINTDIVSGNGFPVHFPSSYSQYLAVFFGLTDIMSIRLEVA